MATQPQYQPGAKQKKARQAVIAAAVSSGAASRSGGVVSFKSADAMEQAYNAYVAAQAPARKAAVARAVNAGVAKPLAGKLYKAGYALQRGAFVSFAGAAGAGVPDKPLPPAPGRQGFASPIFKLAQRATRQSGLYTSGVNSASIYASTVAKGKYTYTRTKPPPPPGPQGLKSTGAKGKRKPPPPML